MRGHMIQRETCDSGCPTAISFASAFSIFLTGERHTNEAMVGQLSRTATIVKYLLIKVVPLINDKCQTAARHMSRDGVALLGAHSQALLSSSNYFVQKFGVRLSTATAAGGEGMSANAISRPFSPELRQLKRTQEK